MGKSIEKWKENHNIRYNVSVVLVCIGGASAMCAPLRLISDSDSHVPLIFVLAVFLASRYTSGYWYGLLTAVLAVLGVNYAFTYPYLAFNFSMTGYPLTFVCFLGVSLMTSALTSQIGEGEKARMEGERERMRANLLRAISHDLRTPLTGIVGALNTVLDSGEHLNTQDRRALLAGAKLDAEWMITMVENLLSITRVGGEAPEIHKELQAAEEVISEAVSRFRKQYTCPTVEVRVPDELLLVPMDAMLIEQVILNLLVNTALHGGAEKAALTLSKDGDFARFSVTDNGAGFSPEVLRRLMEGRSPHGEAPREQDTRRTMGIGLMVCKTIVAAHGGSLIFGNRQKGGACVAFTLPLDKESIYGTEAEDPDC